jgi:hypothetical protein
MVFGLWPSFLNFELGTWFFVLCIWLQLRSSLNQEFKAPSSKYKALNVKSGSEMKQ